MENASKALLIAGGVLLSILIVSLIILLNTSITGFESAQNKEKEKKEIVAFNREYEVYKKSVLHGTDVITVVNKAIEHNNRMDVSESEKPYYINVIIKTKEDFSTSVTYVDKSQLGNEEPIEFTNLNSYVKEKIGSYYTLKQSNEKGYSLGEWQSSTDLEMDKNIVGFFSSSANNITINGNPNEDSEKNKIYYVYTGLTNFKRAIFKCSNIKYSDVTGRVNEMEFEQIKNQ